METTLPVEVLSRAYRLGRWESVRLLPGGKSQHYHIVTTGGEYVLRRSHRSKTAAAMTFEHSLIRHLRQHGFPAPEVVPTGEGGTWLSVDGRLYSVSVFVRGSPYQAGNREHLREVARALARYHSIVDSFRPPCLGLVAPFLPEGLGRRLRELPPLESGAPPLVARGDGDPRAKEALALLPYLLTKGREVLRALEELYPQLPPAVVHAGCRRGSALFQGDRLLAMLDFDSARLEARTLDLAVALHDLGKVYGDPSSPQHKVALDLKNVREFLLAYREVMPLREAELEVLPAILMAKRLRRALGRCHRLLRGEPLSDGDLRKVLLEAARVQWLEAHARELQEALASAA
ncbi:Homoserine kinase [bacterium HR25]|jgi:homoserine kinase type II|nr:Homoserine kinase [bacterium HR25]